MKSGTLSIIVLAALVSAICLFFGWLFALDWRAKIRERRALRRFQDNKGD